MSFSFTEHQQGCTPIQPCVNCRVAEWLRGKLSPALFAEFRTIVEQVPDVISPSIGGWTSESSLGVLAPHIDSRSMNCLVNEGFVTIGELIVKTRGEMFRIPNFGRKSLDALTAVLLRAGFSPSFQEMVRR